MKLINFSCTQFLISFLLILKLKNLEFFLQFLKLHKHTCKKKCFAIGHCTLSRFCVSYQQIFPLLLVTAVNGNIHLLLFLLLLLLMQLPLSLSSIKRCLSLALYTPSLSHSNILIPQSKNSKICKGD